MLDQSAVLFDSSGLCSDGAQILEVEDLIAGCRRFMSQGPEEGNNTSFVTPIRDSNVG
jgi:hypothetical protein